jgi:hypothetical protein
MPSTNRIMFAIMLLLLCAACTTRADDSVSSADAPDAKHNFGVFTNPEPVTIEGGYTGDAMEPFVSPDGQYLFFNNSNSAPTTNLYYATRIDDVTFQYVGEIVGANQSGALTAVASMDINNIFYFISNRSYGQTFSTIYSGMFSNGSLSNVALVPGVSKNKLGDVNFDQCISQDGGTLYFVDGVFSFPSSVPKGASIAIARRHGDHFVRLKNSAEIMRKINTHDLNYAPDVSKSGLEFFFTRIPIQNSQPKPPPVIYTATRSSTSKPFGVPRKIDAISGFAEAPALSPDEKSLYFHLNVSGTFVIYRVTRP